MLTDSRFVELAQKLGLAVEHLWPQAVRHVLVEGVSGFIMALIFGGIAVAAFLAAHRADDDSGKDVIYVILGGVIAAIAIILLGHAIPILLEPEGYLVRSLLK